MREIKFKIKYHRDNKVHGPYSANELCRRVPSNIEDVGVMLQYTGLKDKNGKEIYEGDIVKVKYDTTVWGREIKYDFLGQVKFGSFESEEREGVYDDIEGWYLSIRSEITNDLYSISLAEHNVEGEIIGNIHENPELLEVKTEV